MTVRELLVSPKFLDAIGGGLGVLLMLALYAHVFGAPPRKSEVPCVEVPHAVGERPTCVRRPP
jgi:hypothetical protein